MIKNKLFALLFLLYTITLLGFAQDKDWLSLADFVSSRKASLSYEPLTGIGYITKDSDVIRFKLDFPIFILGSGKSLRAKAIREGGKELEISQETVKAIESWFNEKNAKKASHFSIAAIIIDPGHGGKDPGAIGEFGTGKSKLRIQEKDITLNISKSIYQRLIEKWPDKTLLITRTADTYPSLDARVDMANEIELGINEAVIYVSIHANASFNKAASGFEVWYLNPEYRRPVLDKKKTQGVDKQILPILNSMLEEEYTTESVFLAKNILASLQKSVGDISKSRGILAEEWFVVRNAKMPSVLVEVGFVTNEEEAKLLSDQAYLNKLADGIYNGIIDFVNYFEQRKGP